MRKILIGLFALSAVAAAQTGQDFKVDVKAGFDLAPEYNSISFNVPEDVAPGVGNAKVTKEGAEGTGFEVAAEVTKTVYPNFDLGLGIAYQNHPQLESSDYGGDQTVDEETPYDSVPLYVTGRYNVAMENNMAFYFKGNLGYSFNINDEDTTAFPGTEDEAKLEIDVDNGLYLAVGGGVEYNNWIAELMYQINYAEVDGVIRGGDFDGVDGHEDIDYSRVSLLLGYSFDMQY
jgi:hypothetical protein